MPSFNQVVLMGNVTRDPELKYTQGGTAVTEISIAVNERVKRGNDYEDQVSYFDCTAFGRTAEVLCEYVGKGDPLHVAGKLRQETWEDRNGGGRRSKIKVIIDSMQMLKSRNEGGGGGRQRGNAAEQYQQQSEGDSPPIDDDIPF